MCLALCFTLTLATQLAASVSDFSNSEASNHSCPIWTKPKVSNGSVTCECENWNRVVSCNKNFDVWIAQHHCMTYSEVLNKTVVGRCSYNLYPEGTYLKLHYWQVPRLKERNNTAVCQFTAYCDHGTGKCIHFRHQTGLMCTGCVDGYAYPVYSYNIACVECKNYKYNWLKYIVVAFLPLTIFYITVVLFRIPATSGAVNGYILMCQLVSIPWNSKWLDITLGGSNTFIGSYLALFGIWNLDFFRGLYTPFCLYPKLTTLQTLMLDYVIAVYPLLLVSLTYFCVKLHNRYSIVVWLWTPFYKCFALVRKEWDINRSLVGAFATFILLSYVKILNVSFYALTPNTLYDVWGNKMPKRFLYYDGTYEYFGRDHIPYALLALFMLLVFNIFPLVFLCLYPCRCFHRCLNYFRLRLIALHIFMDTFHGCYKLQPRDCRLFAAVYLFLRILNHTLLALTLDSVYFLFAGIVFAIMIVAITAIRPYKSPLYTLADTVFFAWLSVIFLGVSNYHTVLAVERSYLKWVRRIIVVPMASLPPLYGIGLVVYFVIPKKILLKLNTLFQYCNHIIRKPTETEDPLPYRFYHSDEYPPLLPVPDIDS